jgi:micrococcal nuclease
VYQYKCTIIEVTDGDTIKVNIDVGFNTWINNVSIRLLNVDTPESRTTDSTEKIFGNASKDYIKKMLPEGSKHVVTTTIDDKYGRVLGDFIIDGKSLCEMIVKEGYGVPYKGQNKSDIKSLHLANRTRLIKEGKVKLPN